MTPKARPAADPPDDGNNAPEPASPLGFWERLTAPFPADEIELLPKPFRSDTALNQPCDATHPDRNGEFCGGYHKPGVHLSYVGHAGITTRLNEVCGPGGWDWQPFTVDEEGLPRISGGLWIRLTITPPDGEPVTKIGYGDAPDKRGDTNKELIGDALRNAAMRFGIGTYLWSKSDKARGQVARGDAQTASAGDAPAGEGWDDAKPATQAAPAAAPAPEPHPDLENLTSRVEALDGAQTTWLQEQWKARSWPPLETMTSAAPAGIVQAIRDLITEAENQPPF